MNGWHYLLLVNIYLVLFYSFYALLLRKETFFQLNRIYLVSASLLSFIIPLIQSGWVKSLFITEEVRYSIYGQGATINFYALHPVQNSAVTIGQVLLGLYIAGITFLTIRFAIQLIRVNKLLNTPEPSAAFAFFNKINLGENALDQQAVLAHEQVHARQWHSLDVLMIESVMIINWFNPIVYLYRFAIKHIHEYIADQQVIKIGADKAEYAMLLVSQTFSVPQHGLVSAFTGSLLKKRILMLQKDRSKRIVLFKYILSAPLFGLMLVLSSATIDDNKAVDMIQNHATVLFDKSAKSVFTDVATPDDEIGNHSEITDEVAQEGKIYEKVDKEPAFPGGIDAFHRFLATHTKYPKSAREKNIQGKVFLRFIVEPNGAITNVEAVKGVEAQELREEAVRVMKKSPRWTAGIVNGKKVRTAYTIPVNFTLELTEDTPPSPQAPQKIKEVVLTPPSGRAVDRYYSNPNKVYEAVEVEPEFPGGQDAFNRFLAGIVRYPAVDRDNNITGKVYVQFVVEPDGSLTEVKAVRGPSETEKAEAVRAVTLSPKWKPGIQNGKPVRVSYTIPVNFTLSRGEVSASLTPDGNKVYEAVEREPEFVGGIDRFNQFLSAYLRYPAVDRDNNITGKVYVVFIIEKDGSLTNVRAVRGPSETMNAEAVRVVSMSPKWRPGIQNGMAVRVSYTVPVNFTLNDEAPSPNLPRKIGTGPNAFYETAQKEPEFPGGMAAFNRFLSNTVKYPAIDRQNNITGKVYVTFIVEKDGSITDARAVRGPSETTKAEAERAVALSPKWNPGLMNGSPVRVSYSLPVNFTLTSDKSELDKVSSDDVEVKWLRIRNAANSPEINSMLILVNGKEFAGGIQALNANQISSIDIYRKSDDVVKKYGEKAKNGVIVVTLK